MWVRGLKRGNGYNDQGHLHVAPHVGAWIETSFSQSYLDERESHPMWVRGLKLATRHVCLYGLLSHPMWVRGLKPILQV